jgi:hypothetical protein
MAVTERVDRDARREIEIALAALADQVAAFAAHRTHTAPWVNGHERGDRHGQPPSKSKGRFHCGPPGGEPYDCGPANVNIAVDAPVFNAG